MKSRECWQSLGIPRRETREFRQWRVRREMVGRGGLEPPTSALSSQERAQFVDRVFVMNQLGPVRARVPVEAQVLAP